MDTLDPYNLSEIESLSDSEWLDISSRASEDTDSVAGFSDREDVDKRPLSRLSSKNSSQGSDVRGWEGVLEGTADEPVGDSLAATRPLSLSYRSRVLSDATTVAEPQEDPEEEQRVKDALNQSMMSTLSSPRSNSLNASVQTSVVHSRDLRLSFPDPLTSSRNTPLNQSYENVSVPQLDEDESADENAHVPPTADVSAPTAADPGAVTTPAVPQEDASAQPPSASAKTSPDFYLVLYGVTTTTKWPLVDKLLEKLAHGASITLTSEVSQPEIVFPHLKFPPKGESRGERAVTIVDRTELFDGGEKPSYAALDRPSLAVMFLPTDITNLPEHTLYLPLLAQNLSILDLPYSSDRFLDAEQQWETCGIPRSKVLRLTRSASLVAEADDVERARPLQVARALHPVLQTSVRGAVRIMRPAHAFTLFAVLSLVLGCVIKGSFISSSSMKPTAPPAITMYRPAIVPLTGTNASTALIASSLKDFALAVLNPASVATTSATRLASTPAPVAEAPSECACGCGLITWSGKSETVTDLALHPTTVTPAVRVDESKTALALIGAPTSAKGKGKGLVDDRVFELSTRVVGALAEYFDFGYVVKAVQSDLQDIYDALDALADAIGRTAAVVWSEWGLGDTAAALRRELENRNQRALGRAQELRNIGGRWFESVRDRVRDRAGHAGRNARAMREGGVWGLGTPKERREEAMKVRRMGRERRAHRARTI